MDNDSNVPYKVSYRKIKHPRLELTTGELLLVLPFNHSHDRMLTKYTGWIRKKTDFIKACLADAKQKKLIRRSDDDFRKIVASLTEKITGDLNVTVNRIQVRKMKTKWASLSKKRNLTINRLAMQLPGYLIRYIIFHEACHMTETRHNERYWAIISKYFRNYQDLERELFVYWFIIIKKTGSSLKSIMGVGCLSH